MTFLGLLSEKANAACAAGNLPLLTGALGAGADPNAEDADGNLIAADAKVGFTTMERWLTFSPAKNDPVAGAASAAREAAADAAGAELRRRWM